MRKTLPIVLAAVAAGLLLWALRPGAALPAPESVHTAARGDLSTTLVEMGAIEAKELTVVYSPVTGDITWLVDEGTRVKAGEPIVRFNDQTVGDEINDSLKQMAPVSTAVTKAEQDLAFAKTRLDLLVRQAEQELADARLELRRLKAVPTPEDRRLAELNFEIASLRHEKAQRDYNDSLDLSKKGFLADNALKQSFLALKEAEVSRLQAQQTRDLTLAGAAEDAVRRAETAVFDAELKLEGAAFNRERDLVIAQQNVAIQKVSLKKWEDRIEQAQRKKARMVVPAPKDGVAIFTKVWKGDASNMSRIEVGESRSRNSDLLKIADLSAKVAIVYVNETDLHGVKIADKARVRLVSHPEKEFAGRVTAISDFADDKNRKLGSLAMDQEGVAGVAVVELRVTIDPPRDPADYDLIRLGATAVVEIVTGEYPAALLAPLQAVFCDGDKSYCLRLDGGGRAVRTDVRLGPTNATHAVILDGLKEGDRLSGR